MNLEHFLLARRLIEAGVRVVTGYASPTITERPALTGLLAVVA